VNIEVLEWDRVEMRQMQGAQRIGRYVERAGVCDAREVSPNIQGVSVTEKRYDGCG